MHLPKRKTRAVVPRPILAAVLLVSIATAAPHQLSAAGLFYHSDDSRIPLTPSTRHLAVQFESGFDVDLGALFPAEIEDSNASRLERQRLAVYRLQSNLTSAAKEALIDEIESLPAVERVVSVFKAQGALMIVTDEFIARFAPGVSAERIREINSRHDVETIRTMDWSDETHVLRVKTGTALETANAYHELPEVLFAHPDFVRLMNPRPQQPEGRTVVAPDGTLAAPETAIEKGMSGYRVIEPATGVLAGKAATRPSAAPRAPVSRTTIKGEGFEGSFPNEWTLYGSPTWSDVDYRSYAGSWSGYCVGSTVAPPGPYPADSNAWMVYGPFSLTDALDARVDLQAWVETEPGWDYFKLMASVDGSNFWGYQWSGDWVTGAGGDGWRNFGFDLTRVYTLGDLRGEPEVWLAIIFQSDSSENFEGVYVDEVVIEKITGGYEELTSDVYEHLQWSLNNNEQLWGVEGADIEAPAAWGVTHGSHTITVAIIDEGVDLTHPDLAAKLVPGYDATDGDSGGGATGDDAHGTACAGIATAVTDNALGVAGIAREARIMPVRIAYDDGAGGWVTQDSWLADGIAWAVANGADVLSNSWGGGSPATIITDAIANAKANGRGGLGSVVVFAAGNDNGPPHYPGTLGTVLSVGALSPCDERKAPTSCDGEHWWGSNYGPELDLTAPGVHMYTSDIAGVAGYDLGDYYYNFNGTSSATPVVAGVAGLLLGLDPTLSAAEAEAQLLNSADDLLAPGWDPETGFGRVNAFRALTEVPEDCHGLVLGHTGQGADPAASPSSSPGCSAGEYHEGALISLVAAPDPGWTVGGWSGTDDDASTATTNTVTMPGAGHTASVDYVPTPCYPLTLNHTGGGTDPVPDTAGSPGCSAGEYHQGALINLTAAPDPGWTVGSWSGTDNDPSTVTTNTVTMPGASHTASVHYVLVCFELTLTHTGAGADPAAAPPSSGGCTPGTYLAGEPIQLTADPAAGWSVGSWGGTDDDSSTSTVNTLTMPPGDHSAQVNYVQVPAACHAMTLSHSGAGSDPTASPASTAGCAAGTYAAGDVIGLQATPTAGWTVGGWTGTDYDSSAATTNVVTMPDAAHTAAVDYATLDTGYWTTGGPAAGVLHHLTRSRSDADVLYAGASVGIYLSADNGGIWVKTGFPDLAALSLAVSPDDAAVLFAGTDDGIYKSTDGGRTWAFKGLADAQVNTIAIDPNDPQIVFAGTGWLRQTSPDEILSVFRSPDGGETWQEVLYGGVAAIQVILVDPQDSSIVYAGVEPWSHSPWYNEDGLFRSTDGGFTWVASHVSSDPWNSELITAFAMTETGGTPVLYAICAGGLEEDVYKSTDRGVTWSPTDTPWISGNPPWSLTVAPSDPDLVFASTHYYQGSVYKSTDGGGSWQILSPVPGNAAEAASSLLIDPRDLDRVSLAFPGAGILQSDDAGASWSATNDGLNAADVADVDVHPSASSSVLAASINGFLSASPSAGTSWSDLGAGPFAVEAVAYDPSTPSTLWAGDGVGYTSSLSVYRSDDSGASWTEFQFLVIGGGQRVGVTDLWVDPHDSDILLVGVGGSVGGGAGLYRTTTAGATWAKTGGIWTTTLAGDPAVPGVVYKGTRQCGYVHRSTNSGATWSELTGDPCFDNVTDIAVDSNSDILVTTETSLHRWDGAVWTELPGLPSGPNSVTVDTSAAPTEIYVGTASDGVLRHAGGGVWTPFNNGLGSLAIRELIASPTEPKILYAGAIGGSVWSARLAPPSCYALTLGHTGAGADPVPDVASSVGCDPGEYHQGAVITLTAAPSPGWAVASWSGTDDDGASTLTNTVTMPGAAHVAGVNYVQLTCHALSLSHTGQGADPAASPSSSPGCSAGEYHEGALISLAAAPDPGWIVGGWSGTDDDASTATTNTVTMPGAGHTASVDYVPTPCYPLTLNHTGGGADPVPDTAGSPGCSAGEYHQGALINLTAAPDPGWTVGSWSGTDNDPSTATTNTVTMPGASHTASVHYAEVIFADGFESGDTSAWSSTVP